MSSQEAQLIQGIHALLSEGTPALHFPCEIEALIMRQAIQNYLQLSLTMWETNKSELRLPV